MGFMASLAGVLCFLLAVNWHFVLRRKSSYVGWRRRAVLVALAFSSAALCGEFVLTLAAYFYPLNQMEDASLTAWTVAFLAVGIVTLSGFVLATIGQGPPRMASVVWSIVSGAFFFVHGFLSMNSFH
jgi:hypothetical protein